MQLELRHLRTLCEIANAGSLSKAAVVLGVSQPALTAQLRRIEATLGGQIYRRGRLGMTPTPFGRFVLIRARAALQIVDELMTDTTPAPDRPRVARMGGYANPVLGGLLRRLFGTPGTPITVHTEHSPRLLMDLLASKRLDAATLVDYPGHELAVPAAIGVRPIAMEPVFVAMAAGHPLASLEEVPLARLADDDWVLSPPDGAGWPECFVTACRDAGFEPRVPHIMIEAPMIRLLVAAGQAVTPCQATFPPGDGIVVRPLAGAPLWMRHLVAWRLDGALADRAGELVALATQAHQEALAAHPVYSAWQARRHFGGDPRH
ncbi:MULTISPECIES: LysR family transcriptional regulator [Nonomuraea]|uniref:LysR family transcriptional regulator n=1 Tax=Nonomuraea ferruginea TaxID=46174 RepID=A0ABT4SUS5_9ACTN|nr:MULTISPECIES: LysR family transcriptional regulator [Nonomuraea]MDA0640670.1 LysR family transcriptional regulator [Nonomuraea ferruginea]TXK41363.1 LysR family transcriptional regulator [Nonomuraea sp. C10]